jgi:hypothetical protein
LLLGAHDARVAELERVTAALRERFVGKTGGCLVCDDYWENPDAPNGLECACGTLALAGGARAAQKGEA